MMKYCAVQVPIKYYVEHECTACGATSHTLSSLPQTSIMASEEVPAVAAQPAATAASAPEGKDPVNMPPWRMPAPVPDMLQFFETCYPLKVQNSLTRSKVRRNMELLLLPASRLVFADAICAHERAPSHMVHVWPHCV